MSIAWRKVIIDPFRACTTSIKHVGDVGVTWKEKTSERAVKIGI